MSKVTEVKDGIEQDNVVRPAFTKKYLDSERDEKEGEVITLRLNREERQAINDLKKVLSYSQDAKVIKAGLVVLRNVVHGTFGDALMSKISGQDRRRAIFDDALDNQQGRNL